MHRYSPAEDEAAGLQIKQTLEMRFCAYQLLDGSELDGPEVTTSARCSTSVERM